MHTLRERLLCVTDDFLVAIAEGGPAVERFSESWLNLRDELDIAIQADALDEDTISLAHSTSSRIAIFASAFHGLYSCFQELTLDMVNELESSFSRLSLSDIPVASHSKPSHYIHTQTRLYSDEVDLLEMVAGIEPFEQAASSWLVTHIENPYPSTAVQEAIARSSKVKVEDVNKWFRRIRREIGWNTLRASHFGRSRQRILQAAQLAFSDSQDSSLGDDVIDAFLAIKAKASLMMQGFYQSSRSADVPSSRSITETSLRTQSSPSLPGNVPPYPLPTSRSSSRTPSLTLSSSDESESDRSKMSHCTNTRRRKRALHDDSGEDMQASSRVLKRSRHWSPVTPPETPCPTWNVMGPNRCSPHEESGNRSISSGAVPRAKRALEDFTSESHDSRVKRIRFEESLSSPPALSQLCLSPPLHTRAPVSGALLDWAQVQPLPLATSVVGEVSDAPGSVDIQVFSDWSSLLSVDQSASSLPAYHSAELAEDYELTNISSMASQDDLDSFLKQFCDDYLLTEGQAAEAGSDPSPSALVGTLASMDHKYPPITPINTESSVALDIAQCPIGSHHLDPSAAATSQLDIVSLLQGEQLIHQSPPPSFAECVGDVDVSTVDWDDIANVFGRPYSMDHSPPPPYETWGVSSDDDLFKIDLAGISEIPSFDWDASLDMHLGAECEVSV